MVFSSGSLTTSGITCNVNGAADKQKKTFRQYWQRSIKSPFFEIAFIDMKLHFDQEKRSHY